MQTGGTLIEKVQRCVRTTICIMDIRFIIIKVSIFSYLDFTYHYLGMGAIEKMFLLSFQILKLVVILMLKELYARAQNRLNFQILAYLLTIDLLYGTRCLLF